jgi:hypothetical protein
VAGSAWRSRRSLAATGGPDVVAAGPQDIKRDEARSGRAGDIAGKGHTGHGREVLHRAAVTFAERHQLTIKI